MNNANNASTTDLTFRPQQVNHLAVCLVFVVSALSISGRAYASPGDWVLIGDPGNSDTYIDSARISGDKRFKKYWLLLNRPITLGKSMVYLEQIDCREEKTRTLQFSSYPESMGVGKPLAQDNNQYPWAYIGPGTKAGEILKIICKK